MAVQVLIAVKGSEDSEYFRRVAAVAPLARADVVLLVHVVDAGPRREMEMHRDGFLGRRGLGEGRSAEMRQAEEERARAGLQFARQALLDAGVTPDCLQEIVVSGRPNEEIRRLAEGERVDLIVVGGRSGKPGPHSIGKTARFLIDHAPTAALLVR